MDFSDSPKIHMLSLVPLAFKLVECVLKVKWPWGILAFFPNLKTRQMVHFRIKSALEYPLDRGFRGNVDAVHFTARTVAADLNDRRGIRQKIDGWSTSEKEALVSNIADVIRRNWGLLTPTAVARQVTQSVRLHRNLGPAFDIIDDDVMEEIHDTLAELMVEAMEYHAAHGNAPHE